MVDKLFLQQLLATYDIIDTTNEYFDKYVDLVLENLNTKYIKRVTQHHHIVPVIYYAKQNNLLGKHFNRTILNKFAKADSKNFCINLSRKLHAIAHCYLLMASKHY
jgi:hypothetical protein